ncbi:ionic transporter y4hA [Nakamurella antarctica]|uniref:Ionic transporter y4hA n=1 Tax=Nakamurella antarctica TaxID=1902245 RepID=A0A3G8ZSQ0_9ACTN|nr:ionic transporter y4hA [Nakamurella antarctica]AZI56821.1 ionic transporter y4hA [Nakamurella antarctica]
MSSPRTRPSPLAVSTAVLPVLGVLVLALAWTAELGVADQVLIAVLLVACVLSAVHHAEVVAHRVGEPYGSLILAVAVTIIEVGLIITLMLSGTAGAESLARDTAFAALMITINGIAGLVLLLGALRGHIARFNAVGTASALAVALSIATLTLVLPKFTTAEPGPIFTASQLTFAAAASAVLYLTFVFVQNIRHRDYFLPPKVTAATPVAAGAKLPGGDESAGYREQDGEDQHSVSPSDRAAWTSAALLLLSLVAVVGLAKIESPAIEAGVSSAGLPASFVGVVIAVIVLFPEALAAARNAVRDRVQVGLNLAYGSAAASIGLTIPTIAVASIWLPGELILGLSSLQITLLALTGLLAALTLLPGRATVMQATMHLVVFASFLYFAAVP